MTKKEMPAANVGITAGGEASRGRHLSLFFPMPNIIYKVKVMKKILLLAVALLSMNAARADGGYKISLSDSRMQDQPPHVEFKYYGFYGIVDFSYMMNLNDNTEMSHLLSPDKYSMMGITAIAGFQWRQQAAVGMGFSYLDDPSGSFSQVPVFLEYRCYFLRSRFTPYVAGQIGWSIPLGTVNGGDAAGVMDRNGVPDSVDLGHEYIKINKGGITFGVEAGGRVAIRPKFGINIYVGYQMISLREVERGYDAVAATRMPELYHHFKAGIGFCF